MPEDVHYQAEYTLFGVTVQIVILADGRRAITAESMAHVLAVLAVEQSPELIAFGQWLRGLPAETP